MKFYEFLNPYYALIKADNKQEATKIYIDNVAGGENEFEYLLEECKEVSKEYAVIDVMERKGENNKKLNKEESLEIINKYKNEVLLIDRYLL